MSALAAPPASLLVPPIKPVVQDEQTALQRVARDTSRMYRMATADLRAKPTFLIIGAMKGGTTSLFDYLAQHPSVDPAEFKELQYFTNRVSKSMRYYRSFFPFKREGGITGEATPQYLYHPHVPARVAKAFPEVKLIVLLRDPVRRTISHHNQQLQRKIDSVTLEEALDLEEARIGPDRERLEREPFFQALAMRAYSYVDRGRYAQQLQRWFEHFPREQFLIMPSEAFFHDPNETYERVLSFLGLAPHALQRFSASNARSYAAPPETRIVRRLAETFAPENERLFELLGERFDWTTP